MSPLANANDSFTENINIIRIPLEKGQIETRDEGIAQTLKTLPKLLNEFEFISKDQQVINNQVTDLLTYTFKQGVLHLKTEQRFVLANEQMYILTISQPVNNPDFTSELRFIADSFLVQFSEK